MALIQGETHLSQERSDLVAFWSVPLIDGVHTVEFEHGTTTGKRVVRIDGQEIIRKEWMFKLVGDEKFSIGKQAARCELKVDPLPYFAFSYSLYVDGKPLEKFTEQQSKTIKSWGLIKDTKRYRIVFDKDTLNVWVNGNYIDTEDEFTEDGTEIRFQFEDFQGIIKANSIDKKMGIIHELFIEGKKIDEDCF